MGALALRLLGVAAVAEVWNREASVASAWRQTTELVDGRPGQWDELAASAERLRETSAAGTSASGDKSKGRSAYIVIAAVVAKPVLQRRLAVAMARWPSPLMAALLISALKEATIGTAAG